MRTNILLSSDPTGSGRTEGRRKDRVRRTAITLGTKPGVLTQYITNTPQGNGKSTCTNPGQFISVTFKISLACVLAVYWLGYFQGHSKYSHSLLYVFHFKYILSAHIYAPTQNTAIIFFQYIQNFPISVSPTIFLASKQAVHSKSSHPVPM